MRSIARISGVLKPKPHDPRDARNDNAAADLSLKNT